MIVVNTVIVVFLPFPPEKYLLVVLKSANIINK